MEPVYFQQFATPICNNVIVPIQPPDHDLVIGSMKFDGGCSKRQTFWCNVIAKLDYLHMRKETSLKTIVKLTCEGINEEELGTKTIVYNYLLMLTSLKYPASVSSK